MELYYAVSFILTFTGKEAKPGYCRFISPDLVEYLDIESINGTNLYCYCMNDPINYYDPSGNFIILARLINRWKT